MFRKYEPLGASTAATLSAIARYQATYSPAGTGMKPLDASYWRCEAYGGDVMATLALAFPNRVGRPAAI